MYLFCSVFVNDGSKTVLYLMTAYDAEREVDITMTYVPAHLYYMLFELMKVSISTDLSVTYLRSKSWNNLVLVINAFIVS